MSKNHSSASCVCNTTKYCLQRFTSTRSRALGHEGNGFLMRHVALSVSEHPHGCRIKSITHLTLPRKPVTLHSAKKISALARKIDRCRQTIVYIHTSLGLKTSFNSDKQPWTGVDAQAHPPFLNSYTDADGSFASAS